MGKIQDLIKAEKIRQANTLMMIPSENYTYAEVRETVGSVLMQKYAEGQPGKRYYNGNSVVDEVELYCEEQALKAFGLSNDKWAANVQPHSGSEANLAVYNALLTPGDKILSMFLPDGGHLSHGWEYKGKKITLVSKIFDVQFYHVYRKSLVFDYDQIEKQAKEFKPKLLISGGTAYPREINHKRMAQIAQKVGAYYLADIAHEAGLVAGGANKSPFPFADVVTMTTHKTLRGPRGAIIICRKDLESEIDAGVFPGLQGGPHLHTIAGIAVALEKAQSAQFKKYAKQVVANAQALANDLAKANLNIVSDGTDKHLVLVDLRSRHTNGWFVAHALEAAGIIVNRNTVPYDTGSPFYPSGIRLGTPALTARGMTEKQMSQIASWIVQVIDHVGAREIPEGEVERREVLKKFRSDLLLDEELLEIAGEVGHVCGQFPVV